MLKILNEKKYLAGYDLSMGLFNRFDLKVYDIVPVRSVFFLYTSKGQKVLKKVNYTADELNFINSAIKYIKRHFDRIMDFVETKDGMVYTLWKNDMYCVMDMVDGRECDFANPVDVSIASTGIGELHKASLGFKSTLTNKYMAGRLEENFKHRLIEMRFFKDIANMHEIKSTFDDIFLSNCDYYIDEIERSIKIIENSAYLKICSEEDKVVLCHHDLAHHNILINDEKAYFIDFDYAVIDLKVHDLCNFINKVVKNFGFDITKAENIINDYCKSYELDKREFSVLYGMLTFPEDFYNISKDYYTGRKEWDEDTFLDRLIKKVNYKDDREKFLEQFTKLI